MSLRTPPKIRGGRYLYRHPITSIPPAPPQSPYYGGRSRFIRAGIWRGKFGYYLGGPKLLPDPIRIPAAAFFRVIKPPETSRRVPLQASSRFIRPQSHLFVPIHWAGKLKTVPVRFGGIGVQQLTSARGARIYGGAKTATAPAFRGATLLRSPKLPDQWYRLFTAGYGGARAEGGGLQAERATNRFLRVSLSGRTRQQWLDLTRGRFGAIPRPAGPGLQRPGVSRRVFAFSHPGLIRSWSRYSGIPRFAGPPWPFPNRLRRVQVFSHPEFYVGRLRRASIPRPPGAPWYAPWAFKRTFPIPEARRQSAMWRPVYRRRNIDIPIDPATLNILTVLEANLLFRLSTERAVIFKQTREAVEQF